MKKRFGFTLAEVLITLGIIGVVAAMTIPTLISNTNSAKFRSQFKKTISTLNQAGLMAQAQYDIDFGMVDVACTDPATDSPQGDNAVITFCSILNGTLTGQSVIANPYGDAGLQRNASLEDAGDYTYYSLADGSLVAFPTSFGDDYCTLEVGTVMNNDWIEDHAHCVGFVDVNGKTLPNKEVTCGTGDTTLDPNTPCTVPSDATHITDIFPIVFHDATVEPASNAAKYVLTTSK